MASLKPPIRRQRASNLFPCPPVGLSTDFNRQARKPRRPQLSCRVGKASVIRALGAHNHHPVGWFAGAPFPRFRRGNCMAGKAVGHKMQLSEGEVAFRTCEGGRVWTHHPSSPWGGGGGLRGPLLGSLSGQKNLALRAENRWKLRLRQGAHLPTWPNPPLHPPTHPHPSGHETVGSHKSSFQLGDDVPGDQERHDDQDRDGAAGVDDARDPGVPVRGDGARGTADLQSRGMSSCVLKNVLKKEMGNQTDAI